FDVAGGVRRRIAGIVLDAERRLVGADLAEAYDLGVQGAIEFGGEARDLAAIGIAAGARSGGIRVGDVFRDPPHPAGLRAQARGRDPHRAGEIVHVVGHDVVPLTPALFA